MERNQAEYNIHDYVQNNKKSFEQQEFNNVDGVVMTQIANMNLDSIGIDINSNKSLSVKELYEKMRFSSQYIGMSKDNKELLKEMAESPRYREMIVSNYVNNPVKNGIEGFESIGMDEYSEQFAAVTISYKQNGKTIHYMSFRATDGSNDGWNEDLLMIYSKKTQAQADSVAYMNIVGKQLVGDLIGGGHSKGGNDFEYGYLYCDDEVRKRIKVGYLYDSPGLQPEIIHDNKNYLELQKILEGHFICPQDSIVGQLLHENDNAIFVNSVEKGFNEHDPYSWQIDPQTEMFVETQQSELSKYINRVLDKAVENMSVKEREALFTYVSYILYNGSDIEGIEGLADLFVYEWKNNEGKINYKKIANIGKVLINDWINLSPTQQNNLKKSIGAIFTGILVVTFDYIKQDINIWIENTKEKVRRMVDEAIHSVTNWTTIKLKQASMILYDVYNAICSEISQFEKWWNGNFNRTYSYVAANPYIVVDTTTMRTYASSLSALSRRAKNLDSSMNSLYRNLGIDWSSIAMLAALLKAEVVLDFAGRLDKCADYLNQTAEDFENVERTLITEG